MGVADHGREPGAGDILGAGLDAPFALDIGPQEQDAGVHRRRQDGGAHPLAGVQPHAGEHRRPGQGVLLGFRGDLAQGRTR